MTDQSKLFWQQQSESLHRETGDEFYSSKAQEHCQLMTEIEKSQSSADLGCGAGELLSKLVNYCNVTAAIDYSESMLNEAKKLLGNNSTIDLLHEDVFDFMAKSQVNTWMACGSINQYLDKDSQRKIIQSFTENPEVKTLFLFDTLDPDRYRLLGSGNCSYKKDNPASFISQSKYLFRVIASLFTASYNQPQVYLSPAMGYGFRPFFWNKLAQEFGLDCQMVSSQIYEYRYHLIIRKRQDI